MITKKLVVFLMILTTVCCFCGAETFKEDFEKDGCLKKWELEGNAAVSGDQFHSGKKSLFTPVDSNAVWRVSKDNKFGTVTFWVYDSKAGGAQTKGKQFGPHFGVNNSDDDRFELVMYQDNVGRHGWGNYYYRFEKPTGHWGAGADFTDKNISKGWHKIIINNPDDKTVELSIDEKSTSVVDLTKAVFTTGFNGVVFGCGKEGNETFYFDDIEIKQK